LAEDLDRESCTKSDEGSSSGRFVRTMILCSPTTTVLAAGRGKMPGESEGGGESAIDRPSTTTRDGFLRRTGLFFGAWVSYERGWIVCRSGSGRKDTGRLASSILLNVIEILRWDISHVGKEKTEQTVDEEETAKHLFRGSPGTQCSATLAPLPLKTNADL